MLYSTPHARIPRPRRRHLLHRSHRPDRLRHRPADSAVLRAALRRRRAGLRRGRRRVLADAVRGDGAARETVGPHRPPAGAAHDDDHQRDRLLAVRVRGIVLGAVPVARRLGLCRREYLGRPGVHGRHHDAGRTLPRHGDHRRRLRDRVQLRARPRRLRGALRRHRSAGTRRGRPLARQLRLRVLHPPGIAGS